MFVCLFNTTTNTIGLALAIDSFTLPSDNCNLNQMNRTHKGKQVDGCRWLWNVNQGDGYAGGWYKVDHDFTISISILLSLPYHTLFLLKSIY